MPCQVNRTSLYTLNGVANTRKIEISLLCPNCPRGRGGRLPYKSDGDARRLAFWCRLQILVSFGVFGMESYYISPFRYRLVLCRKESYKKCPDTDHTKISLRGQFKLEPHPHWSPLVL